MKRRLELKSRDLPDSASASLQRDQDIDPPDPPPGAEADDLIGIISDLDSLLTPVEPRREFSAHLRAQLLGERPGIIKRLRKMPGRLHAAALLALVAGFVLLWARRLSGATAQRDITEEAIAAPL